MAGATGKPGDPTVDPLARYKGTGGGSATDPTQYSDQFYKNLQANNQLGGSTTAERIISDELAGNRPGQSATHTSGTYYDDADVSGSGDPLGPSGGPGGGVAAQPTIAPSLQSLATAAAVPPDVMPQPIAAPESLRPGLGQRQYPQYNASLAALQRAIY